MNMRRARPYPRVIVTKKAARALAGGHPWVFEGEVMSVEPSEVTGEPVTNGDIVDVVEQNGTYRGTGLISLRSKIRVRIVSRNANDQFDQAFWRRKIQWAWDYRKACMGGRALPDCEPDTRCCRVIFSEADGFPGLTVDRYEDVLVAQANTVGMDRLRSVIYPLLLQVLAEDGQAIRGIYERSDAPARAKEGLPQYKGWWNGDGYRFFDGHPLPKVGTMANAPGIGVSTAGRQPSAASRPLPSTEGYLLPDDFDPTEDHSTHVIAHENGLLFDIDLKNSQKTGFFLDQKYNRRAVRELARGRRVLDCFSHVGPFGLNAAAGGAEFVRCVDVSQTALDLALSNARLNGLEEQMGFTCANVLEYLPQLKRDRRYAASEGGPFDLVVLDPPAFTKSRSTVDHALKGYREINQAALQLLPRGGYLATCSCSHFMTTSLLERAIAEAAYNANVQLRQVEQRQQAPDHPILWGVPETHYLDFFIFQVV